MFRFTWNNGMMVPANPQAVAKAFVEGRRYWLEEVSERSWISHQHQFAFVNQAWDNLPEALADTFPTPEHLRKAYNNQGLQKFGIEHIGNCRG